MTVAVKKTKHPYISIDPKISGGQPVISGTRIKVMDIAIKYELMGMNADEIISEYPHLRLEQIHDALSYYYEHKEVFDKKYRGDQSFLSELKRQYPSKLKTKLTR
ncbi:MAG: DUF433 domain-containing protein [Nitrospirota bacterium]